MVVLIAMLAIGGSRYENFLTGRVIANVLINNSFLVVIAVGMTFVILTGGIDLSVGAVVALSGCVAAWMFTHGYGAAVAIPAVILVGTVIGLVVGVMVHVFEIQPFIATLAAMFLARGLCYIVAPESIPITDPTIVALARTRWGTDDGLVITPSGVIALAVVAIAFVTLHYTRFGRTVYAIGGSEQSAQAHGPARGAHQGARLRHQRHLRGARRPAVRDLLAVRLRADRCRHGARRHRRGRHRRHAADRWQRLRPRARCSACWCWA